MMGDDDISPTNLEGGGSPSSPSSAAAEAEAEAESYLTKESSLAYAGICISAIILLIALTGKHSGYNEDTTKNYHYGISVAVVAMIFSSVGWFLAYSNAEGTAKVLMYNNYFLFVWNFIGAGFLTFGGPFEDTSNGYFASWGMVVFSTMAVGVNAAAMQQNIQSATKGAQAGLLACSIVVMTAISFHGISRGKSFYGELVYSLIISLLTILIMGAMLRGVGDTNTEAAQLYVMISMSLFWAVAAGLLTFRGPFDVTGNGYFASWGAAFSAVYGVNEARKHTTTN